MPWQKKFPGLAGVMSGVPTTGAPTIAPVGLPQAAQATKSMGQDLKPMTVPSNLPPVPMLQAQPNMAQHEEAKKRALANIAIGHKGF